MLNEDAARADMVRVGQWLHAHEYVDGTAGNLTARLGPDRVLATPSGLPKGQLTPEQLIIINLRGEVLSALPGLQPTSEMPMHLEAYRRRPDVNGVVHAHPITCVALSIAGVSLAQCVVPEAVVLLGPIPTVPYSTPSSEENQRAISDVIVNHDALVLQYHGSLTVGRTLDEAYLRLESLEHTAKIIALTHLLGGGPALPPEQVTKLIETRKAWGLARPNDEANFCVACGVCHAPGGHVSPGAPSPAIWDDVAVQNEEELVRQIVERVKQRLA